METTRDIKRRINSVQNTRKITRAMKMVAAAKLKKAQRKAQNARPFFQKTREVIWALFENTREESCHPLLQQRGNRRRLYVIITADRGLCGAYNARVIERAEEEFKEQQEGELSLLLIGRKGRDYFSRRGYNLVSEYVQIPDYPGTDFSRKVSGEVISLFEREVVDRVSLIYTHFNSALSQSCRILPLLPVTPELAGAGEGGNPGQALRAAGEQENEKAGDEEQAPGGREGRGEKKAVEYIYEPSAGEVLDFLLPKYVNNIFYSVLLESKASEFGSRMTAMDAATDNAGNLIEELSLYYNRARQAAITREISEIVGGAEALR